MPIQGLLLKEFTAFENAEFRFCPGVNVLIGHNSTGKSHVMKLLYTLYKSHERGISSTGDTLHSKLAGVFKPDLDRIGRLVRRGRKNAEIGMTMADGGRLSVLLDTASRLEVGVAQWKGGRPAIFLPTREVLAMYEGFIAAYENRELSFDETYYDACVALSGSPLRGPRKDAAERLIEPLKGALGGSVTLDGKRFYVHQTSRKLEAHLVAEGLRKIASLVHLVANGALQEQGILFWDEPEANLNPRLVRIVMEFLLALAQLKVQVFIASHDYLLTHRLSLVAEQESEARPAIRFFCLTRHKNRPVTIEAVDNLTELSANPILEEFVHYYDEQRAGALER